VFFSPSLKYSFLIQIKPFLFDFTSGPGFGEYYIIKIKFPDLFGITNKIGEKSKGSYWSTLLLGILFALAFCPYSGVLYFGMLIPITITSPNGLYLPVLYAIATGIPVIIFAWLLAFAMNNVGKLYNSIKTFECWFRRIVAILFMMVGLYYIYLLF